MTSAPVGLSTYAFFWQWSSQVDTPLTLTEMVSRTADLGGEVFQICDYPSIVDRTVDELDALRRHAETVGVRLELGTRGVLPDVLDRYLELARRLDVTLVRSMLNTPDHRPSSAEAEGLLAAALPAFAAAGVTLALETYEQVATTTLVDIVSAVDSPHLGICLDPANCIAALETPASVIDLTAPYVKNIHVKDFEFSRRDGWVGFSLIGAPLGTGQLDYRHLVEATQPDRNGLSRIVEHWLPWQGDAATTVALEQQWTSHNIDYLRSN